MYVILTSKPDLYTSSLEGRATIVETYRYMFYGRCKAIFEIAELDRDAKVTITESEPPFVRNQVSTKFLDHFETREQARAELDHLTRFGGLQASLERCDAREAGV
ncbi:MAG TPA: ferredoxin [Castellaniella sp.]|uniref:ferredoxin n=1 Tax=Castellaniella sp. TaxID=1955812 RepID=UPI002EF48162